MQGVPWRGRHFLVLTLYFRRDAHVIFPPTFNTCFLISYSQHHFRGRKDDLYVNHPGSLKPLGTESYSRVGKKKDCPGVTACNATFTIGSWILMHMVLELLELSWNQNRNGNNTLEVRPEKWTKGSSDTSNFWIKLYLAIEFSLAWCKIIFHFIFIQFGLRFLSLVIFNFLTDTAF